MNDFAEMALPRTVTLGPRSTLSHAVDMQRAASGFEEAVGLWDAPLRQFDVEYGPRSGGIDGKGGFLSLLPPKETIIDHTRGGAALPQMTVNNYVTTSDPKTRGRTEIRPSQATIARNAHRFLGNGAIYR